MKIGADSANDLVLNGESIADFHAELSIAENKVSVAAISNNPVEVNGELVSHSRDLKLGDIISIADREFKIVDPVRETGSWQAVDTDDAKTNKVTASGSGSGWILQGNHKSLRNKRYPINGTVVLGRASECELDFSYDRLSRRHAELKVHKGLLYVRDLSSSNGTFVNGKQVSQSRLKNGDVLSFDKLSFTIVGPGSGDDDDLFGGEDLNKTVIRPALDADTINKAAKAEKSKNRRALASEVVETMSASGVGEKKDNSRAVLLSTIAVLTLGVLGWWVFG